eukprot:s1319_g9.t1
MIDSAIFRPPNIRLSHAFLLAMGCGTSGSAYVAHADPDPVDAVDDVPTVDVDAERAVEVPGKAETTPAVQGWLLETSPGTWEALPEDVDATLTEAYYGGEPVALYTVRGSKPSEDVTYDVDFRQMLRSNRRSGQSQQLRWGPVPGRRNGGALGGAAGGRTQYQWELKNGNWADFEEEELQHLIRAWMMGHDEVSYEARGLQYLINFRRMVQINLSSGQKRHIRVKPRQAPEPPAAQDANTPEPAAEPTAEPAPPQGATAGASARRRITPPGKAKRFSLGKDGKGSASAAQGSQAGGNESKPGVQSGQQESASQFSQTLPALPSGVSWPLGATAQTAAKALYIELLSCQQLPQSERRSRYKQKCLLWHPDKNLDQEDVATEVFQFLQLLRDWLLA